MSSHFCTASIDEHEQGCGEGGCHLFLRLLVPHPSMQKASKQQQHKLEMMDSAASAIAGVVNPKTLKTLKALKP
jgi:hypothetical protein